MEYPLTLIPAYGFTHQTVVRDPIEQINHFSINPRRRRGGVVEVHGDSIDSDLLFSITPDRLWAFSTQFQIDTPEGSRIGVTKRHRRSLYTPTYLLFNADGQQVMTITEESVKRRLFAMIVSIFFMIPLTILIFAFFADYPFFDRFRPAYLVKRGDEVLLRIVKEVPFLRSSYTIEKVQELSETEENHAIISILIVMIKENIH